ncbi:MAG: biotin/lipoyl-containing protein [Bdellovibrionota bacterium]
MKIKIQNSCTIEIPSYINIKQLSLGEKFTVFILQEGTKTPIEASFIADKRSLLLNETVVRMNNLKKCVQFNLIRPVEPKKSAVKKGFGELKSPMTGKIISVAVKNDDFVKVGDVLVVIEAMKMENRILAEAEGVIKNVRIASGVNVTAGENLLTLVQRDAK